MYTPEHRRPQRPPHPPAHPTPPPPTPVATPHQQRAADATLTTDAPAPSRAGTPQSPRQERASKRAAQRHPPQHHTATGIQGHQASPAGGGAVPSPTNTGAVGTRPEQPSSSEHPNWGPNTSPTGSPQPQTPPGASAHIHQPAASQVAATQAHPEPRPRHGTPHRPAAGPAFAPPEDPPTQAQAATPTDTATTQPSDTVRPHAHYPTEGLDPQAPATSSTAAPVDLPAMTHARPAPQRHHAPPAGPTARPAEPSSPGRPAPSPDPGPDPERTTVPADAPQPAGPGSRPGPPPLSEAQAQEAAQPADNEATPPAPPTHAQRGEPTVGAEEMRRPPQRTATPTPVGEPSGGADRPAIHHADSPNMAAHGSGEASTASQPDTEPEGPMPDADWEDGLRPPSARGAQPTGRAGAAPLANLAHQADVSAPAEAPPRDPPETRATSETRETTPDTPQRAAGRETSPSGHNRDENSFDAFMESCMGDPHTVPALAAPRVRPEPQHNNAEDTPLTVPRQAHLERDYTALGRTSRLPLRLKSMRPQAEQRTRPRTSAAPQEVARAWKRAPTPLASLPAQRREPPRPGVGDIWTTQAWRATPAAPVTKRNKQRPETWAYGSPGLPQGSSSPWQSASDGCLLLVLLVLCGPATSWKKPAPWQTSPLAIRRGTRPPPPWSTTANDTMWPPGSWRIWGPTTRMK